MKPRLYADFQNLDDEGRVRLNTQGTLQDLARLNRTLTDGAPVVLYTDDADEEGRPDDLLVDAVAQRTAEGAWVADADWHSLRHASDEGPTNGPPGPASATRETI
ncbi:MAG: hypothetical protein J2P46_18880 [Zavarzinella sp.]|nr:hypothetical protein [Zavarzinella sp.]